MDKWEREMLRLEANRAWGIQRGPRTPEEAEAARQMVAEWLAKMANDKAE
jgi:hypothetical protein